MKLNMCNLLLKPGEFLTTVKESARGLAAAEDRQGERISNAGSESAVRQKVVSYYISSQYPAEWIQELFRGGKQNKEMASKPGKPSIQRPVWTSRTKCLIYVKY